MVEIRKIEYLDKVRAEQILATETCPGFEKVKKQAFGDYYEIKSCKDCDLRVKFVPSVNKLQVKGSCPKL